MYPVYKLIRAINRQYPNNGFISAVDVTEETNDGLIPEDFRDLLNETIQEIYHDIAIDEMFSFPTVPGQREYALPEDCDLRDIQEVTRTFAVKPFGPPPPPAPPPVPPEQRTCAIMFDANRGTGSMEPVVVDYESQYVFPDNSFIPPAGERFTGWGVDGSEYAEPKVIYQPGEAITVYTDITVSAVWEPQELKVSIAPEGGVGVLHVKLFTEDEMRTYTLQNGQMFILLHAPYGKPLGDVYEVLEMYDETETTKLGDYRDQVFYEDTIIAVPIAEADPEEPIDDAEPVVNPDDEISI